MIITRLSGGLGNQMFQYAAGLSLACARRTTLKLDTSWFDESIRGKAHERYALDQFNVTSPFATTQEIEHSRGLGLSPGQKRILNLARSLRIHPFARSVLAAGDTFYEGRFGFTSAFTAQSAETYLHGNWQSERFFKPVADRLRIQFTPRLELPAAIIPLADRIRSSPSAFLHVRRGDYVSDPRYAREIGALGGDYYAQAVYRLRQQQPNARVFVFSDDIDAAQRDLSIEGPHEYVREPENTRPHHILHLMSLCDHAIIANSTFSWWAAWLGEKNHGIVIAPKRWFSESSSYDARDIVPDRWLKL
jgi:hypothetical protein